MAIVGIEVVVVAVVLLVIFIWGPTKIPELARAIGLAKKGFEEAKKELKYPSDDTQKD